MGLKSAKLSHICNASACMKFTKPFYVLVESFYDAKAQGKLQ